MDGGVSRGQRDRFATARGSEGISGALAQGQATAQIGKPEGSAAIAAKLRADQGKECLVC